MTPIPPFLLVGLLAACGAAGAATWPGSAPLARAPAPLICALDLTAVPGGTTIRGSVTAAEAATGAWDLTLSRQGGGGQAQIDQQGRFRLAAGETLQLSDIALNGRPDQVAARLTLVTGGQEIACPVRTR